jgi:hypothetical protein
MRTAWHALVGGGISGQRRFVPRASTAVNYKFAPLGAKNSGASHRRCAQVRSKIMAGQAMGAQKIAPVQGGQWRARCVGAIPRASSCGLTRAN